MQILWEVFEEQGFSHTHEFVQLLSYWVIAEQVILVHIQPLRVQSERALKSFLINGSKILRWHNPNRGEEVKFGARAESLAPMQKFVGVFRGQ